jgi:hypothetical protein
MNTSFKGKLSQKHRSRHKKSQKLKKTCGTWQVTLTILVRSGLEYLFQSPIAHRVFIAASHPNSDTTHYTTYNRNN